MSSVAIESTSLREISDARRRRLLLLAPLVLCTAVSLLLGKKTGWDLFNYHWYNPFALLNGRFGFDIAVGHTASYYSPIADLPLYLIGTSGPAWWVGVFLGALAGVSVSLLGAIAYVCVPIHEERYRLLTSATVALAGILGAGAFQEIGDPANDVTAAIGIFSALLIIVANLRRLANTSVEWKSVRLLLLSGVCAGVAVALKLTTAIYALGIGVAILTLAGNPFARIARSASFGIGVVIGLAVLGGYWMFKLWQFSGNPFFPYFNDLFHSPLLTDSGYMDRSFRPDNWLVRLLFPFYFTWDSHYVSESAFRDAHILALYVLIPATLVMVSLSKRTRLSSATQLLFAFASVSYVAWLFIFDIYRYLIPLEMFAPLLIALAYCAWPLSNRARTVATLGTLVVLQLVVRVDVSDRQSWTGPYVRVDIPSKRIESDAMVLMTGHEPMSYVIPSFPRTVPFLRIDGWLVQGSDDATGLARKMRSRVAAHDGPLYLLSVPTERDAALAAIGSYGLHGDWHSRECRIITSNIAVALSLCPIVKASE